MVAIIFMVVTFISIIAAVAAAARVAVVAITIIGRYFAQECKQIIQVNRFAALLMRYISVNIFIQFVIDLMRNFRQSFDFFTTNAVSLEQK